MNRYSLVLLIFTISVSQAHANPQPSDFFNKTTAFMNKHVHDGRVDYRAIKKNPHELNEIISVLADFELKELPEMMQKAFWINAYNLIVIKAIVENYPINSPMDFAGFFDSKKHPVAGEKLTLNDLENKKIRETYKDPRSHFVLVCAALSCPPIIDQAYLPETLDAQLEQQTKINLNDDTFIRVDHGARKVHISEIFKWYEVDFVSDNQTVRDFINQYRTEKIPQDYSIDFYTYDWKLNEYRETKTGQFIIKRDNLQAYTPSTLLRPGETEVKSFNNLYTQTAFFDVEGNKVKTPRSTFYTNITNFMFGVKPNINIGFDVYFKSVNRGGSPLSVLKFSSGENSRTALTSFAPKIKVAPFSGLRSFSIQTLVLIPLRNDFEKDPFLDFNDVQWWTQMFYDFSLTQNFLLYFENGWFLRFDADGTVVTSPTKAIVNFYPTNKWTVYLPTELAPTWDGASWSAYYFQAGLGAKYQLTSNLELELLYTKFLKGKQAGAGVTYNIGVRIIE